MYVCIQLVSTKYLMLCFEGLRKEGGKIMKTLGTHPCKCSEKNLATGRRYRKVRKRFENAMRTYSRNAAETRRRIRLLRA